MGDRMTNGEKPHSQTIDHITSYPVVHDSIETFRKNPYGQKSLDLTTALYNRFAAPFVPYLRGPYSYVAPYVEKADELGNASLSKVDENFPVVKEDTEKVKGSIFDLVNFPFRKAGEGRDYLLNTYQDQYNKTGGQGVVTSVKALVSTELKVASDFINALNDFIAPRKQEAEKRLHDQFPQAAEKYDSAKDRAFSYLKQGEKKGNQMFDEAAQRGQQYYNDASQKGQQMYNEASQKGQQAYNEASQRGNEMYDQASQKGQEAKGQISQKGQEVKGEAQRKGEDAKKQGQETKKKGEQKVDEMKQN